MVSTVSTRRRRIGRYLVCEEIASGGMASVHLGRLIGPAGFARTVAIKRLHPQLAKDPEFSLMLLDEARLAARIRHPNVVSTLDVITEAGELLLVMDYVHGEALSRLWRTTRQAGRRVPPNVASAISIDLLLGLHAAHEATDDDGRPLGIVHRDVSPQNVLVGSDGVARVVDFGVAKASSRLQTTHDGQLKGKLAYMAPEQLLKQGVDRRTDVYAAGVVLWELLSGERLFASDDFAAVIALVLRGEVQAPGGVVSGLPAAVDEVVLRALASRPEQRFATAREMAHALERALPPLRAPAVGEWVEHTLGAELRARSALIAAVERNDGASAESAPSAAATPHGERTDLNATAPLGAPRRRSQLAFGALLAVLVGLALAGGLVLGLGSKRPAARFEQRALAASSALRRAEPDAATTANATPSAPRTPRVRPRADLPATKRGECNPPFTLGKDGVKRYKPECF
jgi:eukaryotic-like serine/threonine-protein kinase